MTTVLRPQTATRPLARIGLLVLLAGPFLANLDFFITNVALPSIARRFDAPAPTLELIVAGYGIAYAVLLVLAGRLGDERGRRLMLTIGIAAFTASSLLAGLAPSLPVLLIARVLQGASAAFMTPQTLATFQSALIGKARTSAVAAYAAAGGLAAVVGQLLGGILTSELSWRAIFLVNVPVGLAALLFLRRTVPATRSAQRVGVDARGTVLLGIALAALLVPLTEGSALGWPWWTIGCLALFALAAAAFLAWSRAAARRGITPLLPLPLVAGVVSMRRGLPVAAGFFSVFGAFMFVFALAAQDGLGLTSLAAGVAITPVCVAYFATSFVVPRLLARFGRRVLTAGLAVEAVGFAGVLAVVLTRWDVLRGGASHPAASVAAAVVLVVAALIVVGIGQAFCVGSLFRLVLSEVLPEAAGVGSGVVVTTQQTSMAIGVALLGSVFTSVAAGSMLTGVAVALAVMLGLTALLAAFSVRLPSV